MGAVSAAYQQLHQLLINGQWVTGQSTRANTDTNPYNGETLATIQQAANSWMQLMLQRRRPRLRGPRPFHKSTRGC